MSDPAASAPGSAAEHALRADLARADARAGAVTPILRYLVTNDRPAEFSEDAIARVRGTLHDLARQLFGGRDEEPEAPADEVQAARTSALADVPGLLGHLHALALEWHLIERLQAEAALDPIVSPLLQALVASRDESTSATAMNLLAAQARFVQAQRRMKLPLGELPADLLHGVLEALRTADGADGERAAQAATALRQGYDEGRTRLGLIAQVVTGLAGGRVAALALGHAGVSIFSTALAFASGQERDAIVLSTGDGQRARLLLMLRAAGLKPTAVAEQLALLGRDAGLPRGFEDLASERAAAILAAGQAA